MPLQATSGAASYDAFGGGVPVEPNYIESVFSCFLYTGNGSTQTITNGIDLSAKGGLVWQKERNSTGNNHALMDTLNGGGNFLQSNDTNALATGYTGSFTSSGFTTGTFSGNINNSAKLEVSWTFRKQPKFFDVVTYTGNGANRTIAHALGSAPGCIIVKRTDTTGNWQVYHNGLASAANSIQLNLTNAQASAPTVWNSTAPTASVFSVGTDATANASGGTYVAYLFAHNAGGFGLTGTDNVISCGSFTTDGSGNATLNLGYEPQWVLFKNSAAAGSWRIYDSMRGIATGGNDAVLFANLSAAEDTGSDAIDLTATGFLIKGQTASNAHIYIAIRRGPMKVPTSGTSVFATVARTGTGAADTVTAGFPVDMYLMQRRPTASFPNIVDRLRGNTKNIQTYQTDAETTLTDVITNFAAMTSVGIGADASGYINQSTITYVNQMFRRAPSFFDEVCYSGNSTNGRTVNHNLTTVPELMIVKCRSSAIGPAWITYTASEGNTKYGDLADPAAFSTGTYWNNTSPTSSVFSVSNNMSVNRTGDTYVAYLFSTCAGVSKVGSYTGTGTTLQIDCGFTAGSRFVLIKRTSAGSSPWYVWDSARGIVSGNDPYLLLNSTAAEVTNTDYVDTYSAGFEISSTAPAAINASGGTFIFLAIA